MEKCLTPEERKGKEVVIKYLRRELKERLDYLNGEPDNLCKAYQTIIESIQNQLETRDIVKETNDFLHGKTELDAAGFIRADENDKRAPA